jgi:hypothetical protein
VLDRIAGRLARAIGDERTRDAVRDSPCHGS